MTKRHACRVVLMGTLLTAGCSGESHGGRRDDGAATGVTSEAPDGATSSTDAQAPSASPARDADAGIKPDASGAHSDDAGTSQPAADAAVSTGSGLWKPAPSTTWQWDLGGKLSQFNVAADVFDIDGFENGAAEVAKLHSLGKKVICYISVGTYEPGRPDAKDFPKEALGKYWPEWDETYIDIRSEAVRAIMKKRLDMCKTKGFDGIEPDNMDMFEGGASETGFPLTEADGVAYAKWLAAEAHARGMSIGQKNAASITASIETAYDWALTEDCYVDGWCDDLKRYPSNGKALFMCEYTDRGVDFAAACGAGKAQGFSPILKKRDLDSWVEFCK
jgi:endo-alpha-1,4-polygalactosaminidase (GH114 family)